MQRVPVLLVAVVLQTLPALLDLGGSIGLALVLCSYALLLGFAAANRHLVGMPIVGVGLALNALVIGVNGGMPVRPEAILTIDRSRTAADLDDLEFGAKRHLETEGDHLTFLGDVVPVRPIRQVLSFGDLILAVGLTNVAFRLAKRS